MNFVRSKKVQKEYLKKIETLNKNECFICDKELFQCEFTHWVLLKNRFPYSIKFLWFEIPVKNHYLLCPKRHINQSKKLDKREKDEFKFLISDELKRFGFDFDIHRWNTVKESSFKYHLHCQVIELSPLFAILQKFGIL